MVKKSKYDKLNNGLEKAAIKLTEGIGTIKSLIVHSILFLGTLSLVFFGFSTDQILLVLTTWVSLEAIYLSIFIQMTVNRNTKSLEEVEEDIEEIQEDVEGLEDDFEEISEEIEDIQAEDIKADMQEEEAKVTLKNIEDDLDKLLTDIAALKANMPVKQSSKKYLNG
jgi:septal ring factor EnvC (AmiA/AmiB activator)